MKGADEADVVYVTWEPLTAPYAKDTEAKAGVAELVDARDLKSLGGIPRVGSSPTFGTA